MHYFIQTFSFQCTGCPLHYFPKSYVLHILPSNWQLATFMLLQVDIAKILSMLQYYMLEINFHSWMSRNFILTQVSEFCSNFQFRLQISYAKSYPVQNIILYLRLISFLNCNCLELWKNLLFISFISWVIFCKYFCTCH